MTQVTKVYGLAVICVIGEMWPKIFVHAAKISGFLSFLCYSYVKPNETIAHYVNFTKEICLLRQFPVSTNSRFNSERYC